MIQIQMFGRPRRLFYGWVIVAAGFANQALISGLGFLGFGTFIVPLEAEFGWSKAALSGARSVMQAEQGLLGPIEGILIDRFGPRVVMMSGVIVFGAGMVALSRVGSLWAYYVAFFLIAMGTSMGGFLVLTTALNNWFRRKRTLAIGLATTGFGLGGVVVVPLLVWAQGDFGWRTAAFGAGLCVWAIGLPVSMFIRRAPEQYGALPDGDPPEGPVQDPAGVTSSRPMGGGHIDFTLKEAAHTRAFWLISLGHGMSGLVVSAVMVHVFAHMEQGVGLTRSSAALVITVLGFVNIVGFVVGGILGDRVDKRYLSAIGMTGAAIAVVVIATADSLAQSMVFAVIFGFLWGMRGPLVNSMRGDYFGRTSFAKIAGTSSLITMPLSMAGPIFAGFMADARGDYTMAFIILAGASALGSTFFLLTRPPSPPSGLRRNPPRRDADSRRRS